MKKLLLGTAAVLTIATVNTANAQDMLDRATAQPYVGVYGGYAWTDTENSNGADPSPSGADYGIYAGIQADSLLDATVNRTGLGLTGAIEAHYGWSGADDSVGGVNIEKDHEYGISLRPGLSFLDNDALVKVRPYGIIGYRNTNFEASAGGVSSDENYHGFELGLGTELVAYENIGIRLDYTHVWYGEENGIDPDEDNLRVGASYKF